MSTGLDERRRQMLAQMEIKPLWQLRDALVEDVGVAPQPDLTAELSPLAQLSVAVPEQISAGQPAAASWAALRHSVLGCQACRLGEAGGQRVIAQSAGQGPIDCFILGEAPSAAEPFAEQSAQLLAAMLASIGVAAGDKLYMSTAAKCRPAGERAPEADELASCRAHLQQELALLRPRLIIAFGRLAAQSLLGEEIKISAARGQILRVGDTPLIVTYPLDYFLRKPEHKALAWEDMCRAQDILRAD